MKKKFFSLILLGSQWHALACGGYGVPNDYVAHEWGTFTSVQAADGIQLEWNPFVTADLPEFVYDRSRSRDPRVRVPGALEKSALRTLQRMETPVIYFYSDREREVNVTVNFPLGVVTEWYPDVTATGPAASALFLESSPRRRSFVRWDEVRILPRRSNASVAALLPADKSTSHYYAARETDADFLRMPVTDGTAASQEHEKFLFYRGVGSFKAPLQFKMAGADDGEVMLRNSGSETLTDLFILRVDADSARFVRIDRLAGGQEQKVKLNGKGERQSISDSSMRLGLAMQEALVKEGLYAAEAAAMVKTWRDSWFEEKGLRVLYLLPRDWTDRILPLDLQPRPRELVRVMVGRAEMITPQMEWELMRQIVRFSDGDDVARQTAIQNVRHLGPGRFAEPATRRLTQRLPVAHFTEPAWQLVRAAFEPSSARDLVSR